MTTGATPTSSPPGDQSAASSRRNWRGNAWPARILLLFLLLAGFTLRVWHVDWADGQLPHPDERSTVAFYAPSIRWPAEGVSPLDKRQSPLNPLWDVNRQERRSYTYGHFPLYLLVLTANAAHELAPLAESLGAGPAAVQTLRAANGVPGFALVGRVLMAIADTGTVLLVYLLAAHIYGRRPGRRWVGLLAAAFSAFTLLQIQLSHFFAVDPISTTFTLLALYAALRMTEGRAAGWAVAAGIGAGLAIASKFSALPILAAPVVAGLLIWRRKRQSPPTNQLANQPTNQLANQPTNQLTNQPTNQPTNQLTTLILLALLVALLTFAITSPFAILDWENFQQAVIVEQGAMVRGDADFPFTRQYRGTLPYLYHIYQQVRWGMGWPLGILAFAGLAWASLKALRGRANAGELIILSWIAPYFGLTGLFLAKFMRYMAPVTPLLLIFAAGLVVALARRSTARPFRAWLAALLAAVALLGAIFWSLAYVNGVYNNTHPWITASRWIYANVPDGSTIAWESWDDSLPYDLPEPNASRSRYRIINWGPFEEDTPQKFELLKSTLHQADYLSLASNRIYDAVDNLPQRYPMTNRYYELLFDEQLGYELALKETNHPSLFGIEIDDEDADESFTLYDHPTVLIFRKVRDLSDAEWDELLGGSWQGAKAWDAGRPILLSRIWALLDSERQPPVRQEPGPDEGPDLLLDPPLDELPVVQDFRWNGRASRSVPLAVLTWWLALALIGLLAWPLTFVLFANLQDRGYLLARSLGLLLMGYPVWLAASLRLARNALATIGLALLLLAALSLVLWWRHRAEMGHFWRARRRLLLLGEGLFAAAYLLFILLRIANPDIWQPWNGGEKFMEFAFLNAILRSPYFPPLDPYFAGGVINYYYYGHYLVSLLIKLTGIWSSVAFNLAIPSLFALAVANVFSLGYNLAGRWRPAAPALAAQTTPVAQEPAAEAISPQETDPQPVPAVDRTPPPISSRDGVGGGLLAALFVLILGNLEGGAQVLRALAERSTGAFQSNLPGLQTAVQAVNGFVQVLGPATLPPYRYWDPSRVIPFTINEFPYWSFLFADLHPHLIGIPFTVLFLALAYSLLQGDPKREKRPSPSPPSGLWHRLAGSLHPAALGRLLAMALVLGALAVINTWDLPTYFGLAALTWLLREWRSGQLAGRPWPALLRTALFAASLLAIAIGLYLPFFQNYTPLASSGLGLVRDKTALGPWLNIWGFWGLLVATYLLVELRRRPAAAAADDPAGRRWLRLVLDRWASLPRLVRLSSRVQGSGLGGLALLLAISLALALLLWLAGIKVLAVLVLPLAGAGVLLLRRSASPQSLFVASLVFTALLVLAGVEVFFLRDHLQGGDFYRMNTLFKFYIQVWVMLGLASAAALPAIWRFIQSRWQPGWRIAWMAAFTWLLLLSLVFPIAGSPTRLDDRFPRHLAGGGRPAIGVLDGMAYMQAGVYTWHPDPQQAPNSPIVLRYDYEALRWLLDNVQGAPVVAEAVIGYYREGGLRVASFTGFPTFLGFHQEGEQRYSWQTGPRRSQAEEFWNSTDLDRTRQLMAELDVAYVYVGQLERIVYPAAGLAKFQRLVETGDLEVAYSNEQVIIYRVLS